MRVLVAKTAGYCYGVKRATRMAFEAAAGSRGPVHSLGAVIHNPQVVGELRKAGVRIAASPAAVKEGTAIIAAHGRPAADIDDLVGRGISVVDATCPHVKLPQRRIAQLAREGFLIVLLGDADHPEVQSVASYAGGARVIIVSDAANLPDLGGVEKVGVVVQTTQSKARFDALVKALRKRVEHVEAHDTICRATKDRQAEAKRLAGRVDAMVVLGGRDSANTRRLCEISRARCPRTWQIESAAELKKLRFKKTDTVGVTAGASTPEHVIKEVVARLEAM